MDDYGVEEFKSSSADSKATQDKTPVDEVIKAGDKLANMNIADDPNLYKQKKKREVETHEVDEDAMYTDEPTEYIVNSGDTISQNFQMIERKKEGFCTKDTLFVFMGQEFLYLDYNKDTWAMGDVQYVAG